MKIFYYKNAYMDVGRNFMRAVVIQSIPVSNCSDSVCVCVYARACMCDSLHVTSLAQMLLLAATHTNASFEALLDASLI